MTKQVDEQVFETVRRVRDGQWRGGVQQFGLKEKAVDYVFDAHNQALVGDLVRARVEQLRGKIIAGEIKVPDR
jgi:basic membrane protein A